MKMKASEADSHPEPSAGPRDGFEREPRGQPRRCLPPERRGAPVRVAGTRGGIVAKRALLLLITSRPSGPSQHRLSDPPSHVSLVAHPLLAEVLVQLLFLSPDKESDEGYLNNNVDKRTGRSKQQCCSEEDEYISAEWVS